MEIFISNLIEEIEFHLEIKGTNSFAEVITQGLKTKKALIKKGLVKIYKDNKDSPFPNYNSDKPKFWNKNKNVVNDGIVDARTVKNAQPVVKFAGQTPTHNNTNYNNQNKSQNN